MKASQIFPFAYVSLGWFFLSLGLCFLLEHGGVGRSSEAGWLIALWAASLLDMIALTRCFGAVLSSKVSEAFVWGSIKIACLGLFGALLLKASAAPLVPMSAIVLGVGTLVVVPSIGGIWWSVRYRYA